MKKKNKLSVVLATRNEEENIGPCLKSVGKLADEIIIFDEYSEDGTVEIAKKYGARVRSVKHEEIFHKTKQKALEAAKYEWILQLDADERVSGKLSREIAKVIEMSGEELLVYRSKDKKKRRLFEKHEKALSARDGRIGNEKPRVAGFLVPRVNFFLGKPMRYGGVYPDGVIRLVRKGMARFPAKSVHEQIELDGQVRWLENGLEHHDSPTFERYLARMNRYTDLYAEELKKDKVGLSYLTLLNYSFLKPFLNFLKLYIRHKGVLEGYRGFVWALFSSLHFPLAYFKYWGSMYNN